jgi:predicted nucleotidyltransferase component of viral defense system
MIASRGQFLLIKQDRALKEYENARKVHDIKKKNFDLIYLKNQLSGNAYSKEVTSAADALAISKQKRAQANAVLNSIYNEFDQLAHKEIEIKERMKEKDLYDIPAMRDHNRNMSDAFNALGKKLEESKENDWANARKGWQRNF